MTINRYAFELSGVTEQEYRAWCKDNNLAAYKTSTKREFFKRIQDGRLRRNALGQIERKYKKRAQTTS